MFYIKRIIALFVTFHLITSTFCQEREWGKYANLFAPVPHFIIQKTNSDIKIDGKAEEPDWKKAKSLSDFGDIRGKEWPKPFLGTRVKMMWDDQNLYVFAELEEPNLRGEMTQRDELLFNENNFEIFIDPDGDTHNYYEFEVNVLNTIFDLFLTKPYRNGGTALFTWNAPLFQSVVRAQGTINNPNDTDKNWSVEMKIPFSDLRDANTTKIPQDKEIWKINLMRIEWEGGNAADKQKNPDGIKTNYWTWSPQGLINLHYPERWGLMQFSKKLVGESEATFKMPITEELKKYLWLVYYKQKDFLKTNGKYATTLKEISVSNQITVKTSGAEKTSLLLNATELQFTIAIEWKNEVFTLNETGLLSQYQK